MSNNTEAIAATIAAHTPIGTRYQLVAIPGTELTTACTNCGGVHHVQQCPEIAAATDAPLIARLRKELTALTKAANLAYDAIDWELQCYATDDGPPPRDLLNAHTALFGLLCYAQHPKEDDDELPF